MDAIDLQIVKLLLQNCRSTYREIAEQTGITLNAVYKRVKSMHREGLIMGYTAKPSLVALKAIEILIIGKPTQSVSVELMEQIAEDEHVYFVGAATNGILLINAFLRDISEMHEVTQKISQKASIEEERVLIRKTIYDSTEERLTKLDYKILKSLADDARKSATQLSEDVGVSTKTARKRLDRMQEYNLVEFSINFAPRSEGIIVSHFEIQLDSSMEPNEEFEKLISEYGEHILYIQQFSNKPKLIILTCIVSSNTQLTELYEKLLNQNYKKVEQYGIFNGVFSHTWRDLLFQEKLSQS